MNDEKVNVLSDKIAECGNNPKKLYRINGNILGTTVDNPLPTSSSDEALANPFTDFFMTKIKTIRDTLDNYPKNSFCIKHVTAFESFNID